MFSLTNWLGIKFDYKILSKSTICEINWIGNSAHGKINTFDSSLKSNKAWIKRMSNYDAAFETDLDDDSITYQPSQYLQNDDCSPEELLENEQNVSNEHENLQSALSLLDDRSKDIVSKRWLNEKKATLHDLAAIHNISAERVRQIESSAIKKLRNSINK